MMRRDTTRQGKRLLLEALAAADSALKLSSAIASARKVFRDRELQENAELQVREKKSPCTYTYQICAANLERNS